MIDLESIQDILFIFSILIFGFGVFGFYNYGDLLVAEKLDSLLLMNIGTALFMAYVHLCDLYE